MKLRQKRGRQQECAITVAERRKNLLGEVTVNHFARGSGDALEFLSSRQEVQAERECSGPSAGEFPKPRGVALRGTRNARAGNLLRFLLRKTKVDLIDRHVHSAIREPCRKRQVQRIASSQNPARSFTGAVDQFDEKRQCLGAREVEIVDDDGFRATQ